MLSDSRGKHGFPLNFLENGVYFNVYEPIIIEEILGCTNRE
jgi:hypothetical protein